MRGVWRGGCVVLGVEQQLSVGHELWQQFTSATENGVVGGRDGEESLGWQGAHMRCLGLEDRRLLGKQSIW